MTSDSFEAHVLKAQLATRNRQPERVAEAYEAASRLALPGQLSGDFWFQFANALKLSRRLGAAEDACRAGLQVQMGSTALAILLFQVLYLAGKYAAAYEFHDRRLHYLEEIDNIIYRLMKFPLWTGDPAQRVVICCEQGIGDNLHYLRYVAPAQSRCAALHVAPNPMLLTLLARHVPTLEALRLAAAPEDRIFDAWLPIASLPRVLQRYSPAEAPSPPYVTPDPARLRRWQARLAPGGFKVGLVWRGNPAHANDAGRSATPALYAGLADLPIRCYSLQLPRRPAELPGFVEDLAAEITDIEDTAAILQQLDLVLSVDTSIAHLAGAMGKPIWMALCYDPDYRWGCDDSTITPWYPSMRLFRQPRRDDWESVAQQLVAALRAELDPAA